MTPDACPLPRSAQTRNLLIYAACMGLMYLAAPVTYVGVQTPLCDRLGASATVANLPKSIYLGLTFMPVVIAWCFPYVALLRVNLVGCFAITAVSQVVVMVALVLPLPANVQIMAVILQAAVAGAVSPAAVAFLWEVIGRGVSESRRGLTLSLAFGVGPILAVVGSLASQVILKDDIRSQWLPGLEYPWTFASLFAYSALAMGAGAFLCTFVVVPLPKQEAGREPFLIGVFGGLWDILSNRVLLTATLVTILIYTGNTIDPNMNLNTRPVLGEEPEQYAGLQMAIRFGFKVVAGLLLGWVLTKTNPRAGILLTGGLYVAAQLWAMTVPGTAYLLAFGLYGAGELIGVYAPNYILSASPPANIRRNMAFVTMLAAPAAPAGALFGWIADHFGAAHGPAFGFKLSFAVCAAFMTMGIVIAMTLLPRRPQPAEKVGPVIP